MWRVDNGSENRVRDDCWVPYDTPRPVLVCEDSASGNMMASELIDQNYVRWNEGKIRSCFADYESQLIISIPLSFRMPNDKQIWFDSKDGAYTVKTGYRLQSSNMFKMGSGSSNRNPTTV